MSILNFSNSESQTYYINPLFDLKLGGFETKNLIKGASQLALLFPAAIKSGDSVISNININNDFYDYLEKNVGNYGRIISIASVKHSDNLKVWGWDNHTLNLLQKHNLNYDYPDPEIVKTVNSRKYCFQFNKRNKIEIPKSFYCNSLNELDSVLLKFINEPFVIKPDFGNAGYGFIRSVNGIVTQEQKLQLQDIFKKGYGVVIEPWLNRVTDLSSGFILSKKGKILTTWHHQTLCNYAGTYFANYVLKDDPVINRYQKKLELITNEMANALYHSGYYGPVGYDSFEYKTENDELKFACAIEINARLNVGIIARSILDKVSDSKPSIFRFISKKRHKLPDNYENLETNLGDLKYDSKKKKGVILITPLRVDYGFGFVRSARSAFTVTADSVDELWEMDEELRRRLR